MTGTGPAGASGATIVAAHRIKEHRAWRSTGSCWAESWPVPAESRRCRKYRDFLEQVLRRACKRMMPYAVVEARVKEMPSFAEKIVRKQEKYHRDPNTYDITDRCGARVVTQTAREKEMVCQYIRTHFLVDKANSLDKRSELKDDQFGYLAVHYVVQIHDGVRRMEGVTLSREVPVGPKGLKAEIQVKTLLEHAWANPLHDRLYKAALKLPPPVRRDAAGLMALIEDADGRINRLADQVDSYLGQYAAYLAPDELEREIAIVSAVLECGRSARPSKRAAAPRGGAERRPAPPSGQIEAG